MLLTVNITVCFCFYIYSGTNYTTEFDLSVNCSFSNEICDYVVSNTSTHFKLFYVLGISSLRELIFVNLAQNQGHKQNYYCKRVQAKAIGMA